MDPASVLGQRTVAGSRGSRARQVLIAAEVALTVVLLAGSGLLIRSLIHLQMLPPGFDSHGVLTAQASLDQVDYHHPARFATLMRESVAAMQRIPGVTNAAVGLSLPYERGLNDGVTIKDGKQAGQHAMTSEVYITPSYFDALGMHLRNGRAFADNDTATSQPVAIVNESFARQILHDPHPVGRMIGSDKTSMRIVGVVNDVQAKPGLDDTGPISTERTLYIPATQVSGDFLALVHMWFQPSWIIRSTHLDAQTPAAMQRALASVDPNLPFASFHTMDDLLATALAQQRIEVALLSSLAALALVLAALGIFALVSSVVTDRQREFGIRLALGSPLSDSMVVAGRSGVMPTVVGLATGLTLALIALRAMRSALFGISSYDPLTLITTMLVLLLLAAIASLLPALRIARIQPAVVLRAE
jgi:predicted permease